MTELLVAMLFRAQIALTPPTPPPPPPPKREDVWSGCVHRDGAPKPCDDMVLPSW